MPSCTMARHARNIKGCKGLPNYSAVISNYNINTNHKTLAIYFIHKPDEITISSDLDYKFFCKAKDLKNIKLSRLPGSCQYNHAIFETYLQRSTSKTPPTMC